MVGFFLWLSTSLFSSPQLTIITSVYNGDRFISHFLQQIARQTIYSECQHIIINANSPGNEEPVIVDFVKEHPSVEYYHLEKDPGLYSVWNMALELAQAEFITNANLDERLAPFAYEALLNEIQEYPEIDLVYSNAYITQFPNQTFEQHELEFIYIAPEFNLQKLQKACYIGSHPVWRKSMHEKYGVFDTRFLCAGDWEMWLRAATRGSKFKLLNMHTCVNFNGGGTLSSRPDLIAKREWEDGYIKKHYGQ